MNEEIKIWWKQAVSDLNAAKKNMLIKEWYVSVFLSQQAAEKAFK